MKGTRTERRKIEEKKKERERECVNIARMNRAWKGKRIVVEAD